MAINNMMPPVQLKRPAAPVTDINEVIAALNMQLPEPSVQQAAPTSVNGVAEMLKNQLVNAALNSKIEALKDGIPLEQVTGQTQRPAPVMPVSNRTRLVDESPIHGSTSAATTAFAKTAQSMNNIKAMNEAINQDREYKQYQDTESLNRMIEKLDMQGANAREIEEFKSQERMKAQDAAFEDRMALLNARLEGKQTGGGRSPGRPSSTGAAAVTSDLNQLDAFLLQNGYTQDELDVLTTKQKQAKVGQVAGRQEKIETEEDIVKELSRLDPTKETLNPYIKERREQLENKLARIRSGAPAETGRGRAFNLLLKGSSGAPETLPQTAPAGTPQTLPQRTDSTGNPTLTTDDIIKIINATQNQNGAQPKIKFNPNAGF